MKKIVYFVVLLVSTIGFSQKNELKTLKKIYDKEQPTAADLEKYKEALNALKPLANLEADKVYYDFYNANLLILEAKSTVDWKDPKKLAIKFKPDYFFEYGEIINTTLNLEKKSGKKVVTDGVLKDINFIKPTLKTLGFYLNDEKRHKEASDIFYAIYKLDPINEITFLDNAAILAISGEDYKKALEYNLELKKIGYTGERTNYYATNKENGQENIFNTKEERDLFVKAGGYEKPRDEKIASKKPEIYRTIAVLKDFTGDIEGAKAAFEEAKALNPNNVELLINEYDFYLKQKNDAKSEELATKVLELDPENFRMHYNLGYFALNPEKELVDQINASKYGSNEYNDLLEKRKGLYKKALPHFEKAYQIDNTNEDVKTLLKACYKALDMQEKAKNIE